MTRLLEPIIPGEILVEEFMKPLNISNFQLSHDLDVPIEQIDDVIEGKNRITADLALRLHKYFGNSAEFWMNLQNRYDLKIAKRENWDTIDAKVRSIHAA